MKNSLAPINRIPLEILSLLPDHCFGYQVDRCLVALTQVCRSWRDTLTSRSSLWTRLDFANVDKTRTYIQRSQSPPLKLILGNVYDDDALDLVIPHIHRLKSLTINAHGIPWVLHHFRRSTPLLEKLDINIVLRYDASLDCALFNGDPSSLRELRLHGVTTQLPWKSLANLRVANLNTYLDTYEMTQILDFFESAPLLHTVFLRYSMPNSSGPPPRRIVPLRHLKFFTIETRQPHIILLRHIHIPAGASLISRFSFPGQESPPLDYLPGRSPNFSNLIHITTVHLSFVPYHNLARLSGPSGSLRVFAKQEDCEVHPSYTDRQILRSSAV